jgi:hypothetical protein
MKIVLKQNQFERLQEIQEKDQVNQILIESLDSDDYFELGIDYIRDWLKKNDIKLPRAKVPISWVLSNYGDDIMSSLDMDTRRGSPTIGSVGKAALMKGFVEDPSIEREGSFTENYGKILEKMTKRYLPEYMELSSISEPEPWNVTLNFSYDPDVVIKKGKIREVIDLRKNIFNNPLFKILGISLSSDKAHGGMDLRANVYRKYEWIETVAPKLIKTIKTNMNKEGQIWQIRKNKNLFSWGSSPLAIFVEYRFRFNRNKEPFNKWEEELNQLLFDLGYEFPQQVYSLETKYR